jgi:hypothetical protein
MNRLFRAAWFVVVVAQAGCMLFIDPESRYLKTARDRATQEEVRQRLGAPWWVGKTAAGETLWVYEIREEDPGSRWTSTGMWCDEYVLTFDTQGILRGWSHQSQLHGGELMPMYCVKDGFKPAPKDWPAQS